WSTTCPTTTRPCASKATSGSASNPTSCVASSNRPGSTSSPFRRSGILARRGASSPSAAALSLAEKASQPSPGHEPPEIDMDTQTEYPAFKIKDISLAELGRKKIRMAEKEMPGLMALREEFAGK